VIAGGAERGDLGRGQARDLAALSSSSAESPRAARSAGVRPAICVAVKAPNWVDVRLVISVVDRAAIWVEAKSANWLGARSETAVG